MKSVVARAAFAAAALSPFFLSSPALACASCGCTLTADWLSQGLAAQPGTTFSLRYDYVPQTTLRTGTHRLDRGSIALPAEREIERYTYNHSLTFTLDHQFANDWGLDVQLPVLTRPHSTFGEGTTEPSHSDTHGIGDLRVVGRWQGQSKPGSVTGIEAGLVLPTGQFHQAFDAGPEKGEEVDRGLQPGTGTVQAVLGAYHLGAISPELGYFMQTTGQVPLTSRTSTSQGASSKPRRPSTTRTGATSRRSSSSASARRGATAASMPIGRTAAASRSISRRGCRRSWGRRWSASPTSSCRSTRASTTTSWCRRRNSQPGCCSTCRAWTGYQRGRDGDKKAP